MPSDRLLRARRFRALVPLALAAVLLAGCAPAGGQPPSPSPAAESKAEGGYPVLLSNCGVEVELDAAPQRVLAIKSTSIEMLLALGLEDRIIGTAFSDGPVAEDWSDRAEGLEVVSDRVPSAEAVLALSPDFVFAGWESNVSAEGAGERDALASLGVDTYVSPAACTGEHRPDRLAFDDVFGMIEEAGSLFGVPDRAAELIAQQRARLDEVQPSTEGLTALWYSSGSDTPFVGGGTGAPQMIMDAVGLDNIAADVPEPWGPMSWEAIVDADPDVIVLVDSSWGSVQKKISVLESHPATAALRAVAEERYLIVPFPAGEAGVRNVEAVETLRDQLDEMP